MTERSWPGKRVRILYKFERVTTVRNLANIKELTYLSNCGISSLQPGFDPLRWFVGEFYGSLQEVDREFDVSFCCYPCSEPFVNRLGGLQLKQRLPSCNRLNV